jgi:hypothetical protein
MNQKKEAGKLQGRGKPATSNSHKGTKKRTRIYLPQKRYTLVSKWITPNNVLILDRTKGAQR